MPVYEYQAKDKSGKIFAGAVEAPIEGLALDAIESRGLKVTLLKEKAEQPWWKGRLAFLDRVKTKDRIAFSRQLAVMMQSSIPLLRSMRILTDQTVNPLLKEIISQIADDIEGGGTLSAALAKHPKVFDNLFVGLVKSGETSGKLDDVLTYVAEQEEKNYDLLSKIRGSLIYPIFVVAGISVIGVVAMVFIVPKLTAVLIESGTELPLPTKILIGVSNVFVNYWWLMILILVGLAIAFYLWVSTERGRWLWHWFLLHLPIFGKLLQQLYLARFARTMGTLVQGGVTITDSLEVVGGVIDNQVYKQLINDTIKEVHDGRSISSLFVKSSVVPPMFSSMMETGEQSGKLGKIFDDLAEFYSREVTNMATNMVTLIEPIVIVLLGIAVAAMYLAIIMPMYSMTSNG